jgi:hypothetical protein
MKCVRRERQRSLLRAISPWRAPSVEQDGDLFVALATTCRSRTCESADVAATRARGFVPARRRPSVWVLDTVAPVAINLVTISFDTTRGFFCLPIGKIMVERADRHAGRINRRSNRQAGGPGAHVCDCAKRKLWSYECNSNQHAREAGFPVWTARHSR